MSEHEATRQATRRPRFHERTAGALAAAISSTGLDLKLGLRMLVKYPMLTLVGGLAIAVTSGIGVGASEFVRDMFVPELPFDEGERVVRLYQSDAEAGGTVPPSLYDLEVWRESVGSLEDLGAFHTLEQGLVTDRDETGLLNVARVSASAFRVTRVPPLVGRFLRDEDERPDAPAVVVLGYSAWQEILGGDPDPLGRTVQIAGSPTTIVGVMPEGYGFPLVQNAWVPLRVDTEALEPATAPRANVFARLAPGATLESARAELEVAGRRAASDFPDLYERLSPGVMEFARRGPDLQLGLLLSGLRLVLILLLLIGCANVATLVFARTVTREGEIAVRMSLGATRRRIVVQLFLEVLVLVTGATLVGMTLAAVALRLITPLFFRIQQAPQVPFWWNDALSPVTVVYAGVLALVGALMIGAVPALKATGGSVHTRLSRFAVDGDSSLRFGGVWTVVIVLQVALSIAFLPLAVAQAGSAFASVERTDFPAQQYMTTQLGRDALSPPRTPEEQADFLATSSQLFEAVRDRVAAEPGVRGAALASGLSAMNHLVAPVEFGGDDTSEPVAGVARVLLVDRFYLELMGATVVTGQPLVAADYAAESRSVLVNEAFVERWLGGRNPVGGELRFPERRGESALIRLPAEGAAVEIVGVVRDPGIDAYGPGAHAAIYAPLDWAPVTPDAVGLVGMPDAPATQLFVRASGEEGPAVALLYETAGAVDPSLRLSESGSAVDAWGPVHTGARVGAAIFMAVAGIILTLSAAGVYALMSFTVSKRTREIAIRTALGAGRRQLATSIFRRAAAQLLIGVALGATVAVPALRDGVADDGPRTLVVVSALLLAAGLAACLVPVRRALRIDPAAAMRADGGG